MNTCDTKCSLSLWWAELYVIHNMWIYRRDIDMPGLMPRLEHMNIVIYQLFLPIILLAGCWNVEQNGITSEYHTVDYTFWYFWQKFRSWIISISENIKILLINRNRLVLGYWPNVQKRSSFWICHPSLRGILIFA